MQGLLLLLTRVLAGYSLVRLNPVHLSLKLQPTMSCVTGDEILASFGRWKMVHCQKLLSVQKSRLQFTMSRWIKLATKMVNSWYPYQPLGESRSRAIQRFLSLEFKKPVSGVCGSDGRILWLDTWKSSHKRIFTNHPKVLYLPIHTVCKESITTTKICVVFDASVKTASSVSLNDILMMISPTVQLMFLFDSECIKLHVPDISKMYRAIELPLPNCGFHCFVWRIIISKTAEWLGSPMVCPHFRLLQTWCGGQAEYSHEYPLAAKVVDEAFHVDDCLTWANSIEEGIELCHQLQELLTKANFLLRKWNSSNPSILQEVPPELRDDQTSLSITDHDKVYTKILGVKWHSVLDHFRLSVANHLCHKTVTKRALVSDIAKTYGWFTQVMLNDTRVAG